MLRKILSVLNHFSFFLRMQEHFSISAFLTRTHSNVELRENHCEVFVGLCNEDGNTVFAYEVNLLGHK